MIGRIGPVESVSAIGRVRGAKVYRNDRIPAAQTGGIAVLAARTGPARHGRRDGGSGAWLNDATAHYPAVVLGATAAERLGIGAAGVAQQV